MPDPLTADPAVRSPTPPRQFWFVVVAGAYLTLRGYHSFDGDQAYRLPLLIHAQAPALHATDPFVRAFDRFNPHRGYLALLDAASRPLGLATGLVALFGLTLAATMAGLDRLARAVWPDLGGRVGLLAVVLVLVAKGGNIGTNHLFEATLLDRLVAFGLGWLALAAAVADPRRGVRVAAPCLGLATLVHPSVGLQISLTLAASWLVWAVRPGGSLRGAVGSVLILGLLLVPGLALIGGQSGQLLVGMPLDEFRHWAVEVQGPQHMLPSTWRLPQWLAFGCYAVLAGLAWWDRRNDGESLAWRRLTGLLMVNFLSLTLAYVVVEVAGNLRVTLFQPFRMATLARGLCLVAVAGRLVKHWDRGDLVSRGRATLVAVGLAGDWTLVVATLVEVALTLVESRQLGRQVVAGVGGVVLALGLVFLSRHDTESGQVVILGALGGLAMGTGFARVWPLAWNRRRLVLVLVFAWAVPVLAGSAGWVWGDRAADGPVGRALVGRCRFAEVPVDPAERIAAWCRVHTPESSRFIVPPGEKEFRFWSRRAVAFNRAGSPYHALGLLDWSERFRAHVGFTGTSADFARAYLAGRHNLEQNYDRMTPTAKLALARDQGATHVLERFAEHDSPPNLGPGLEWVATHEGYAVYKVR